MNDSFFDYLEAETGYENIKRSGRFPWGTPNRNHTTTIFFTTAAEAREAFAAMRDIVNQYGYLTAADVADLTGRIAEYSDMLYGWKSLEGIYYIRVANRYFAIALPEPTKLK